MKVTVEDIKNWLTNEIDEAYENVPGDLEDASEGIQARIDSCSALLNYIETGEDE